MNSNKEKQFTSKEIDENVKKINGSMAQEGMPLTKKILRNVLQVKVQLKKNVKK